MDKATLINKLRAMGLDKAVSTIHDIDALRQRREDRHHGRPDFANAEPMTQQKFVRLFGDKVKSVRYTSAADFVGLTVRGNRLGFMVVRHKDHRRIRFLTLEDGHWQVAKKYIPLHNKDSACNMWRGLLRSVE